MFVTFVHLLFCIEFGPLAFLLLIFSEGYYMLYYLEPGKVEKSRKTVA